MQRMDLCANSLLGRLDVVDGDLAGATVFGRVEGNLLAFYETTKACALKGGGVDEHVLAAIVRLNEAEALLVVVELNGARNHWDIPWYARCARERKDT
jgi:hypothetical protein